jgi:hypothetical protein
VLTYDLSVPITFVSLEAATGAAVDEGPEDIIWQPRVAAAPP